MRRALIGLPAAPDATPRSDLALWRDCCAGVEPAEALHTRDREDLVAGLVERGWTDQQIATHTRMTTYTTARIRERLGLAPNQPRALAELPDRIEESA